jgi:predicted transcriptional regulator
MNIPTLQTQYSKINNLLYISYLPKVINAAIDIKLFEILSGSDLTLNNIVEKLNTQKDVTGALLKVLTEIGLVAKEDDRYSLTGLSEEYLVQTSEANQLHEVKRFVGSTGPFDFLPQALKGQMSEFDGKMWSSKEAALNMEQGMKAGGLQSVVSFVKSIPGFHSCTNMCDLAGNIGYFSYAFLQENLNLTAHVYDLPAVCQIAKEVKQNEKGFNRVAYHDFDMKKDESFGKGYDFFFISHFLYEYAANGTLGDFLRKVNRAMKPGGIFVSNHICDKTFDKENLLTLSLVELQTRALGYPTHQLPESTLKAALTEAGFGDFRIQQPEGSYAYPTLLLSAKLKS